MSFFLALHEPHREVSFVHRALSIFNAHAVRMEYVAAIRRWIGNTRLA
jgi:hypothetical protein